MLGYWEGIHGNARPGGCRGIGEVRKAWKSVAMDAGGAAEARGTMSYVESQRNEGRCTEISRDEMVLFCRRTGGVAKNKKQKRKKEERKKEGNKFPIQSRKSSPRLNHQRKTASVVHLALQHFVHWKTGIALFSMQL